jgi:glycosyltransferase involved in cell wall biosynthesis
MRILCVHNDYASPSGEEHAIGSLTDLMRSHGHEIGWFRRSSEGLHHSPSAQAKAFFAGIHNPSAARALAGELDRFRPDAVLVQNLYPLISSSIFAPLRRRKIPVVMRCPNYRVFCPNGRHLVRGHVCNLCAGLGHELWCVVRNCEESLFKSIGYAARNAAARMTGRILNGVDVFVVQSRFQREVFAARGVPLERIEIVPGLASEVAEPPWTVGQWVTFVGRVSDEKGIEAFIRAAKITPEIPFAVVGDDRFVPRIRERAPTNVHWRGYLGGESLDAAYAQARIVVVPSRWYEGFPNVIVQAMMRARPVIGSALGALPDIVEDGRTGLLFRPDNVDELAQKIRFLYARPGLCRQLGIAGREKALREYSPDVCYERLMAAFAKAMNHRRPRYDLCDLSIDHSPVPVTGSVKQTGKAPAAMAGSVPLI